MGSEATQPSYLKVYLWTLSYLKPYIFKLVLLLFCILTVSVTELMIPKAVQYFIDVLLPDKNFQAFNYLLIGLAFLILIMLVAQAIRNMLERIIRERAAGDLQFSIFRHLRVLGFSYYENHPVGETFSLLNTEVSAVQKIYRSYFPGILNNVVIFAVSFAFMASISLKLTSIIVPCFLLYYLLGPYLERNSSRYGKKTAEKQIRLNQKLYESLSAVRELVVYKAEAWDKRRVINSISEFNENRLRTVLFSHFRGGFRQYSSHIGSVAVFLYSAYLLQQDQLTIGGFTAFLFYYFFAMIILTLIVTLITEQRLLMFQAERLYHFMHTRPEITEQAEPMILQDIKGEIEFRDVRFGYPGRNNVLNGFSLHIRPGERVAIVGTSGNGKSTLLKLLSRFYDPTEGEIRLDGVPIKQLALAQLRESLGYVFQETFLYGRSIRDNILFGNPSASEQEIIGAAKAAYADEFITRLPEGYFTIVGERGVKLSGGQKQRISIARLFVKNPAVVLLDEATSALDNLSEAEVLQAFSDLLKGKTVISVAHRISTIKNYDRIVVLEQGQIAESGTYEQLIQAGGRFTRLALGGEQA